MTNVSNFEVFPGLPAIDEISGITAAGQSLESTGSSWRKMVAAGACIVALAGGCSSGGEEVDPPERGQDLVDATWQFMPGVTSEGGALHVTYTGLAVLTTAPEDEKTAKPVYMPNPPVALYGPHAELSQKGNVAISADLTNIGGAATISFLSQPNIRFDERIEHQAGIDITVSDKTAEVLVWDGKSQQPAKKAVQLGKAAASAQIVVQQTEKEMTVTVNGQQVVIEPVLDEQVWFGLDAASSFDVNSLKVAPLEGTNQQVTVRDMSQDNFNNAQPAADGLATIAAAHGHGDKLIGTAVDLAALMADPKLTEYIIKNFNEIETETLAKFQNIQPERGKFQFGELDALVDFASKHNLTVHGHALVFNEAYPEWLYKALDAASETEALDIMRTHITTVMTRYDGKHGHGLIKYWDVVNEPFDADNWGELNTGGLWAKPVNGQPAAVRKAYMIRLIGEAFKTARKANPDAILGLNEWAVDTDTEDDLDDPEGVSRKTAVLNLIDGLPKGTFDFVGIQGHYDEETLADSEVMNGIVRGDSLEQTFRDFADRDIQLRISEASVAENGDPKFQSKVYEGLLRICMHARNCLGFNLWGVNSNKYYFTTTPEAGFGDDAPTTQADDTSDIVERPAMAGLRRAAGS
jgi:endo-1,4-beta-xylanase